MTTAYLEELATHLLALKTQSEILEFLRGILTAKELEEIPKRLQIIKLLKQGVSQRVISERLGVGVATVTRGSKEIQLGRFEDIK